MSPFPRADYDAFALYRVNRDPVPVDLSDNTNLWGMHPAALEAVRTAPPDLFVRYPSLYADRLRTCVAGLFGVDADCVTTGCGSDDVLDSAIRAAARPPGVLSYASPTFVMADLGARMNGLEPVAVPWPRALDDPAALLEPGPDVVYVCSPNNPTGAPLPPGWLERLLDRAGPDGPLVIVDEAYADFHDRTAVGLAVARGRTLVTRTLSKLYALAGARVGYGIGAADVAAAVEKSRGPYKVSGAAEAAAVAALTDASGWARDLVGQVRENRARLASELAGRGLEPLPSVTNFLLVPVAPVGARDLAGRLRGRGVAVRAFPGLDGPGDCIRVTVGPWPLMEAFLEALDRELS